MTPLRVRTWRWRTITDPDAPPKTRRIPSPLAHRHGQAAREVCRGRNGSALFEFADGTRVVAPWRAVL